MSPTTLDPFEKVAFVPLALRTLDPSVTVTVFNHAPEFQPNVPADRFGLAILLGGLAGTRPYGLQTDERVARRIEFDKLVFEADMSQLRSLGRLSFVDLAYPPTPSTEPEEPHPSQLAKIIAEQRLPDSHIVLVVQDTDFWNALRSAVQHETNTAPYRATFKRHQPTTTEKGMKWEIIGGPHV